MSKARTVGKISMNTPIALQAIIMIATYPNALISNPFT